MFLSVSVRHVGAHPGGPQHGVSIQISINLGKTFLPISRIRNILLTWILARNLVYIYLISHPRFRTLSIDTVSIFVLIYFEWRTDTENQQQSFQIQKKHMYGMVKTNRYAPANVYFCSFWSFLILPPLFNKHSGCYGSGLIAGVGEIFPKS